MTALSPIMRGYSEAATESPGLLQHEGHRTAQWQSGYQGKTHWSTGANGETEKARNSGKEADQTPGWWV